MYKCPYCERYYNSINEFNSHKCVVNNMSLAKELPYKSLIDSPLTDEVHITPDDAKFIRDMNKSKEGVKHDSGKPPVTMVPKELILGAAKAFAYGAQKYDRNNFRKGMDWTRVIDALYRHTLAFTDKEDTDPESKLPHLYHMAACVGMLLYYYENKVGKDDR